MKGNKNRTLVATVLESELGGGQERGGGKVGAGGRERERRFISQHRRSLESKETLRVLRISTLISHLGEGEAGTPGG